MQINVFSAILTVYEFLNYIDLNYNTALNNNKSPKFKMTAF